MTTCHVICPCGEEVPVPIGLEITVGEDGAQRISATPDPSQLWLHSFTKHPDAHSDHMETK